MKAFAISHEMQFSNQGCPEAGDSSSCQASATEPMRISAKAYITSLDALFFTFSKKPRSRKAAERVNSGGPDQGSVCIRNSHH